MQLELHIGYVYGSEEIPPNASSYVPKFLPGARLPHAWIDFRQAEYKPPLQPINVSYVTELRKDEIETRKYSTLDLCSLDSFTMIVAKRRRWIDCLTAFRKTELSSKLKIHLFGLDDDFRILEKSHRKIYESGLGAGDDVGLLVRPDQHIMMLMPMTITALELEAALRRELRL